MNVKVFFFASVLAMGIHSCKQGKSASSTLTKSPGGRVAVETDTGVNLLPASVAATESVVDTGVRPASTPTVGTTVPDNELSWEEEQKLHHLRIRKILRDALDTARLHNRKADYTLEYQAPEEDSSSCVVKVSIRKYKHAVPGKVYLKIHASPPGDFFIDLYELKGGKFERVVEHYQETSGYTGDTLRDVNGDGLIDFVVDRYGVTGCCLKALSMVYLAQPGKTVFTEGIEFINPSFFPKEHMVRGVAYGPPGETEMYSFKWIGNKGKNVEYVSFEKDSSGKKTGYFIVTDTHPVDEKTRILKRSKRVPKAYEAIDEFAFGWFLGAFY